MEKSKTFMENLNTSHVIFYPLRQQERFLIYPNLNTSHVIFYLFRSKHTLYWLSFKYISCYLLSIPKRKYPPTRIHLNTSHVIFYLLRKQAQKTAPWYLNTSHVIFYRRQGLGSQCKEKFKYISCYLLSYLFRYHCYLLSLFKYISCYLLSDVRRTQILIYIQFKYISCYLLSRTRKSRFSNNFI